MNCNDGNCKLMVVLDGVNSLFSEQTLVNKDRKMWKTGPFNPGSHWIRGCAKVDECSVPRNIKKQEASQERLQERRHHHLRLLRRSH